MKKNLFLIFFALFFSIKAHAMYSIVAAENFYGDIASYIGGPYVKVTSLLNNASQDPHAFSKNPQMAILTENANLLIANGAGYDTWLTDMEQKNTPIITAAKLMYIGPNANPHLWYNPQTMPLVARAITTELQTQDPQHKDYYAAQLTSFYKDAYTYQARVQHLALVLKGIPVTATEPVANELLKALNLKILNEKFQWAVMNEVDLTPQNIIQFQESLNHHQVKALIYNKAVISPVVTQMKSLARKNHIPVIGVTEMMPPNTHYYAWMNQTLDTLEKALVPHDSH